jgi:hypothetical protein
MNLFDLVQAQQIHAAEVSAERAGNKVIGVEVQLLCEKK